MSIGLKYDKGKPRMWLLPFLSLVEIARVLTFGAEKYAPNSWQNVENGVERYTNALLRHLAAIQNGEIYDPESGLLHWSHVGCNALFLIWLTIKKENNEPYIDIGHRNIPQSSVGVEILQREHRS